MADSLPAPGSPAGTTGINHTYAEILFGEQLTHKFNKTTSLQENLAFFPNLTNSGNYRVNLDITAATAIRKWMSFQVTASDRYLSDPLPGLKTNDILFTTGLRFTFAK